MRYVDLCIIVYLGIPLPVVAAAVLGGADGIPLAEPKVLSLSKGEPFQDCHRKGWRSRGTMSTPEGAQRTGAIPPP